MATIHGSSGAMRERLVLQSKTPQPVSVTILTEAVGVALAVTATPHGFESGDRVRMAGAVSPAGSPPMWGDDDGFNGLVTVTVVNTTEFTYPTTVNLGSPDVVGGTVTATYVSDAQGGQRAIWSTVATVAAEMIPIRAWERLQAAALQVERTYRFRIYARADASELLRALWTPTWPPGSVTQTLEITGVLPDAECAAYQLLECSR